jgi:hypothetical protein
VDTAQKVYDQLDLQRGVEAFLNSLRGVSIYAAQKGLRDAGVKDNEGVVIFSGLMDARAGRQLAAVQLHRRVQRL